MRSIEGEIAKLTRNKRGVERKKEALDTCTRESQRGNIKEIPMKRETESNRGRGEKKSERVRERKIEREGERDGERERGGREISEMERGRERQREKRLECRMD